MNNPYDKDFYADNYMDWLFADERRNKTQLIGLINLASWLLPVAFSVITYAPAIIIMAMTGIAFNLVKILVYNKRIEKWREWNKENLA